MEPLVEYARSSDGTSIAYWATGDGAPFVHMPNPPWSHSLVAWQVPEMRRWFERLLVKRRMIRYDSRGSGLSDRDVTDFSLDRMVADLEAVIDTVDPPPFALFAYFASGPVAIAYSVRHPDRVSHLILWCSYARGADYTRSAAVRATRSLIEQDWETYTETAAHVLLGWNEGEEARRLAYYMREAVEPGPAQRLFAEADTFDVTPMLPAITVPTLVMHRRQISWTDESVARKMATTIPHARLLLLEGSSPVPGLGDMEAVLAGVGEFLGDDFSVEPVAVLDRTIASHGTVIILFADIVDSTALTERMGDAAFRTKARELDLVLRRSVTEAGGTTIEGKLLGDGVLATFPSASQAIDAAVRCGIAGSDGGLPLHLGLHAGDVIREDGNVFGGAVNIASRISGLSAPGEVLVSDIVRGLARTSAGVVFEDRGEFALKGIGDAVRVYAVRKAEG